MKIQRLFKRVFWILATVPFVFTICSCLLRSEHHHKPHYLCQADVFFEDDNGEKYFVGEIEGDSLLRYSNKYNDRNHIMEILHVDDKETSFMWGVTNSNYLFALLRYSGGSDYHCFIGVADKSLNVFKTITFTDNETVHNIACTENYLYIYLENLSLKKSSLLRYDFNSDTTLVLVDDIGDAKSYQDDDVHLFFIKHFSFFRLCKYDEKTRLYQYEGHFKTDKIDLFLSKDNKKIIVNNGENEHTFETYFSSKGSAYYFYERAFLINNKLVFAICKRSSEKQRACDSSCVCSLEESYLYEYDLSSNELSLIKQFDPGTFLIDYDLTGYKYYYNAGLYINDIFIRECEDVYPEYVEHYSGDTWPKFYYPSYYNGEFYGV